MLCTNWDTFFDSSDTIDETVDVISEYINFCVDTIVPVKSIKSYPNNKPWITKDISSKIHEKNRIKSSPDRSALKKCQEELDTEICKSKNSYKSKLEGYFKANRTRDAWFGLKKITGYKPKATNSIDSDADTCNKLNQFYARFDTDAHKQSVDNLKDTLSTSSDPDDTYIHTVDVAKTFKSLNCNKDCGPDAITPRILKTFADQLAPVHTKLFNQSHSIHIPSIWKTAKVIPVPKKPNPSELNDYRPVALTSVPFKCLERLVLNELLCHVEPHLDSQQFAYRKDRSVENATLSYIQVISRHLDTNNAYVRSLFIDFSSTFNTIIPHILVQKLIDLGVSVHLCQFILDFLTDRRQYVYVNGQISSVIVINIGSPQLGLCVIRRSVHSIHQRTNRKAKQLLYH